MILRLLCLTLLFSAVKVSALTNYYDVYPSVVQTLQYKSKFSGDRYGEFIGDDVVVLSDGSAWKIHPNSSAIFRTWQPGEFVDAGLRTDWYWFKREHKFTLYNHNRKEIVSAMLIRHKEFPLRIVSTDSYHKSQQAQYATRTVDYIDEYGRKQTKTEYIFIGYKPTEERKVLMLSDGSTWVIKDHLNEFQLGMHVYVGAQGIDRKFYDFVLIAGTERDAIWTMARPQM